MDTVNIGSIASNVHSMASTGSQPQVAQASVPASAPVQTVDAVRQAALPPSLDQVKQAVQDINRSMSVEGHGLEFSIDEQSDRTIVKVIDKQTEEVIRQIPSEEILAISRSLEQAIGKLLQEKA